MNENNNKVTLGEFLNQRLKERNLTINELHEKTKISKKYLRIILDDDYDNYPALVYLKGFLKKIAATLEVDYEYIKNEFLKDLEKDSFDISPKYETRMPINGKKRPFGIIIVIVLLIILAVIFFIIKQKKSSNETFNETPKVKEKLSKTFAKGNFSKGEKKLKAKSKKASKDNNSDNRTDITLKKKNIKKPEKVIIKKSNNITDNTTKTLQIFAEELTWIRVTVDNKTKKTLYLKKGDNVSFEGKKNFKIDIGNAGGIKIKFNNRDLGYPGKKGEVKHIILK